MAEKITWYGVYARDGEGRPLALFTDGDAAQTYRKTLAEPDAALVAVAESVSVGKSASVAEHFEATAAPDPSPGVAALDPDELLRNELRFEEAERRRRERLQAEVVKELDAADHDDADASPPSPGARARVAPSSAHARPAAGPAPEAPVPEAPRV